MKFARLKPRANAPKLHKLKSYTVFGIKFLEERGWYEVDDDVAAYLKTVKQISEGGDADHSAFGFDVVDSLEDAQALDVSEKKKAERRLAVDAERVSRPASTRARRDGGALTTGDLAYPEQTPRPKKGDSFDDQDDTFPDGDIAPRARSPKNVIDGADEPAADAQGDTEGDSTIADLAGDDTQHAPSNTPKKNHPPKKR